MRNNIWLTVENSLAVSWWQWVKWYTDDPETRGEEPPISEWDKRALQKVPDINYAKSAYKKATISALAPKDKWRLWSMYDIKLPEWLEAGYSQHGEAKTGGDLGVAGVWYWEPGKSTKCAYDDGNGEYPWKPNQVILFMPDVCTEVDPDGNCITTAPATEITDVNLLFSQPPRVFPSQP